MAHAVAVALHAEAISIVPDLVQPVRGVGGAGRSGGKAKLKSAAHGGEKSLETARRLSNRSLRIQNATFDR